MNITRQDAAVIAERLLKYKGIDLRASSLTFADSEEISEYALESVAKVCYNKIMSGLGDKTFAPKDGTTKAMAAVIVQNLLNHCNSLTASAENAEQTITKSPNDKYNLVYKLGILTDEIVSDSKLTRGEFAVALTVFGNYNLTSAKSEFTDVPTSHKYYKEITAVYQNNIMAGATDELFMPDAPITYGEALEAIIAATGYTNFSGGRQEAERIIKKEFVNATAEDALT